VTEPQEAPAELVAELAALAERNSQQWDALHRMGASVDPDAILMTRIQCLVDVLLPPETDVRAAFEIMYEKVIAANLAGALSEARQASILQPIPVRGPSSLIVPKR
jgi:hypothetical protein